MKVRFVNVSHYYQNYLPDATVALNDINFEIRQNECIGIIGPSGSGKTTLVQHFTGLLQPSEGKVFIDDDDISKVDYDINSLRRKIGVIFQFPESQLFEETVYEDVSFGPKNFGLDEDEIDTRVRETFQLVDLNFEKMKSRSPFKLSEGEKRRVALAGIISMNPEMFILDEPTACLDASGIRRIEKLLLNLYQLGKTIILVSHNLDFVIKLCRRIIVIERGKIIFDGPRRELFKNNSILEKAGLELPRIMRYARKLKELEYIEEDKVYSIGELKKLFSV
ncbi:ATP-binding cassette domain-containing protein [candidate division KSB1 bacterium]|nr:ATP-binding cassette domain-containing protein [candidate division KSB1 bacterium]